MRKHVFEFHHIVSEGAVGPMAATLSKWGVHHGLDVASKNRKVQTVDPSHTRCTVSNGVMLRSSHVSTVNTIEVGFRQQWSMSCEYG